MNSCSGESSFGHVVQSGGECLPLTSDNLKQLSSSVEETAEGDKYVALKFEGGAKCYDINQSKDADSSKSGITHNSTMTIHLMCNAEGQKEADLDILEVNTDKICHPVITASHKSACPVFSVTTFSRFLFDRPFILGPIAILFGIMVAFAGRKFFPWTIAVIGCLVGFGITLLLFSMSDILDSVQSNNPNESNSILYVILTYAFAIVIGVFVGFILQKMLNIGALILGAVGGFFVGVAAYNLLFFWAKSQFLLTLISVLSSIAMAFLSFRQYDNIVIFGTGFVGSYSFVRGLSFFMGNFPNEVQFFKDLINGSVSSNTPWEVYFYLVTFVIVFITGVFYQRKQRAKEAQFNYVKF